MSDYKQILEAVKDLDRWPWEIGDALLVECGPPGKKDGYALLWEAAKYLFSEGHEYDVATLSKYRSVAYWFEPSKRRSVAWAWHEAARSPEFLNAVIDGWPKGKQITALKIKELRCYCERLRQ